MLSRTCTKPTFRQGWGITNASHATARCGPRRATHFSQALNGTERSKSSQGLSFQPVKDPCRRALLSQLALLGCLGVESLAVAPSALASKLPEFADRAWEAMGGGPADLYFPELFLGTWQVTSTLIKVELPMGPEFVPNMRVVQRAQQEDLNHPLTYPVTFVRGERGVVFDRAANTAALLRCYYGDTLQDLERRITWDRADPNVMSVVLPGGMSVETRVTRRSMEAGPGDDRAASSEFMEQLYEDGTGSVRMKASQCFTKYKWRSMRQALAQGGPVIVATQVVSEYLTPYDGDQLYMAAMNQPVVLYTYRMAFNAPPPATDKALAAAAAAASA